MIGSGLRGGTAARRHSQRMTQSLPLTSTVMPGNPRGRSREAVEAADNGGDGDRWDLFLYVPGNAVED